MAPHPAGIPLASRDGRGSSASPWPLRHRRGAPPVPKGRRCLGAGRDHLIRVAARGAAVLHHDLALDDDVAHVPAHAGVDQGTERVMVRHQVRAPQVGATRSAR